MCTSTRGGQRTLSGLISWSLSTVPFAVVVVIGLPLIGGSLLRLGTLPASPRDPPVFLKLNLQESES